MVTTFTRTYDIIGELSGVVTLPSDFDPAKESLPVIVFLHGAGERGTNLDTVKIHGIPKLFSKDPDYKGLRVITLSPQVKDYNMIWNHMVVQTLDWIKAAVKEFNGDEDRVSITGLSMGGFGTWEMITTYPDTFSCAAPVCGGGVSWRTPALRGMPIRCYHGLDDQTVPFLYAEIMVTAARNFGADAELIAYDKVGHGSWVRAYEETDLIEWLISKRRSERA
ncbi:MAG: prolyl oligopeptidase family serine peptidase [Clostridia bacterium]|nr:prolyl oligopeptidase family serine peptidase [Clostridia bacterium]